MHKDSKSLKILDLGFDLGNELTHLHHADCKNIYKN